MVSTTWKQRLMTARCHSISAVQGPRRVGSYYLPGLLNQGRVQRPLSQVIIDSVRLTMNTGHHTPEMTDDRSASLSCLSYRVPTSQRKHKIKQTLTSRIKEPHEHELYTPCLSNNPTSICIYPFSFGIFTNSFQSS